MNKNSQGKKNSSNNNTTTVSIKNDNEFTVVITEIKENNLNSFKNNHTARHQNVIFYK